MRIAEFAPEKKWWKRRKETELAWRMSIADIRARGYNLDVRNPNAKEAVHEAPAVPLGRYDAAVKAAAEVKDKLRAELAKSLEGRV